MSLLDKNTRDAVRAALSKGEVTRSQTAVDAAADVLARKGLARSEKATPSMQIDEYLSALERLDNTDENRALLATFLDTLQNAATEEGYLAIAKVRAESLGETSRSTVPIDHAKKFLERILFRDETLPVSYLENGANAAKAVGKLVVPWFFGDQRRPDESKGTAWLLTKKHVVTCVHVVYAKDRDPVGDELKLQIESSEFQIGKPPFPKVKSSVAVWPELDVAILELEGEIKDISPLVCRASDLATPTTNSGFYVNVIQYPRGEDKRVGLRANAALDVTKRDLFYFTDTEKGASGAPCFDDDWRVIGVHRAYELRDGLRYMGRAAGHVNIGTRISQVLAKLDSDSKLKGVADLVVRS